MPRQVKIGFDKVPSPPVKTYHQLVDIFGTPLQDSAGNPLVTEEDSVISTFAQANNSLSSFVANSEASESVPVAEQFGSESEVSTSLLGVTRAEEQLSLFADVSTYGLDATNWNYYTVGQGRYPFEWYNRKHPVFGKRGFATFNEETNEQALYLKSFPTQYSWPQHPRKVTDTFSPTSNFGKYIRFIALGRWLYEVWKDVDPVFAENNFLSDVLTIINTNKDPVPITIGSWTRTPAGGFTTQAQFHNIIYTSDTNNDKDCVQVAMDQIEKWTLFYFRIRNETDTYPKYIVNNSDGSQIVYEQFKIESFTNNPIPQVGQYLYIRDYCNADITRPGGAATNTSIGVLESRKTFRYQPGRVSGFTFGLRLKNNPGSSADKIEWGCANQTDQYMFQVSGTKFNIVRRSTQRIPNDVIEEEGGMNLVPAEDYQTTDKEVPPSRDNSEEMYTLTIPRDRWNGDKLDGSGPSGHIWNPENVTMYKIEYSWYGAIGAKFYAYVPVGNGDCRWVLLHTFVIENKLPVPVLENADFKFRYVLFNNVTENLTEPTFIYKYGSSYYIDGGDEGSINLTSVTSGTRSFVNPSNTGAIIALHPKDLIFNSSTDTTYGGTANNKKIYPLTLSVFSNNNVRIDINRIRVSPDGQHGTKSVDLLAGTAFEKDIKFTITDRDTLKLTNSSPSQIDVLDQNAKVIGDGMYNVYSNLVFGAGNQLDTDEVGVLRRSNYNLGATPIGEAVRLVDGTTVDIDPVDDTTEFDAKLVSYRSIVASDTPIRTNRFKIHFLNPTRRDGRFGSYHWADFAIGVTGDAPTTDTESTENGPQGYLKFGTYDRVYTDTIPQTEYDNNYYFDINQQLMVEWTNQNHINSLTTIADFREDEGDLGTRLEQDYRIRGMDLPHSQRNPVNGRVTTNGVLGCVKGSVSTTEYPILKIDEVNVPPNADFRVVFETNAFPPISERTLGIAELGASGSGTGYVFTSIPSTATVDQETRYVAYINKPNGTASITDFRLSGSATSYDSATYITSIQAKIIKLEDDNKISSSDDAKDFAVEDVYRFNIQPLYLFVAMKSNARINNIIVEEITSTERTSHVPNFIGVTGDTGFTDTSNISIVKDSLVSPTLSPSNFIPQPGLSGVKFDVNTSNPIADQRDVLYSFYVGQNEAVKFGLSNIFEIDRAYLTSGLFNNEALYFNAVPVEDNTSADVQMTLTVKEQ
jgi:hypothetical protein